MLVKRAITAVIGIGGLIYLVNNGGLAWIIAVCFLAVIGWREYVVLFRVVGLRLSTLRALVLIVLIMLCAWRGNETEMMALLVATAVLFAVSEVMAGIRANFVRWAVTVAGIFYISSGFAHLIMLRDIDNRLQLPAGSGWQYTWLTLITVWAADTFAYFGGRFWGKRKLAETISPKKTVEGFLAGIVGGVLAGWLVGWLWGMEGLIPPVVGLIAGTIGPCGDLLESLLKRHAGVKDSGGLFPGHGGVMDRFDSLILVAPFVYYFLQIALQAG